jgi:hypothetical protein
MELIRARIETLFIVLGITNMIGDKKPHKKSTRTFGTTSVSILPEYDVFLIGGDRRTSFAVR